MLSQDLLSQDLLSQDLLSQALLSRDLLSQDLQLTTYKILYNVKPSDVKERLLSSH